MPHGTSKNEHPQSDNVGAVFGPPHTPNNVPLGGLQGGGPAPPQKFGK